MLRKKKKKRENQHSISLVWIDAMKLTSRFIPILALLLLLAPAAAFANDGDGDIAAAQEYFDQGAQYYYAGDYGRALVEFRKAQQAHPHPIFLYNIALTSNALGRTDQALDAARQAAAMDAELPPEQDARNLALIRSCETILDAGSTANRVSRQAVADADIPAPPQPEPKSGGLGALGWAGIGTAAVGVGALTGSFIIGSQVSKGIDELELKATGPDEAAFNEQKSDLKSQQTLGQIMLYSGAGLTAVGASLLVVDLLVGKNPDRPMALQFTPHQPGLQVHMRW